MPPGYPVTPPPSGSSQRFTEPEELLKAVKDGKVQESLDLKVTTELLANVMKTSYIGADGARLRLVAVTVWWGSEVTVEVNRSWDFAKPG